MGNVPKMTLSSLNEAILKNKISYVLEKLDHVVFLD